MDQQAIIAIITLILTTIIFLGIYVVPSLAVIWILYKKAGHPGWNSIVPYYSQWVMGEVAQAKPAVVWIAIGANIFTTFTGSMGLSRYMPVALLDLLVGLTGLVFGIILLVKFIRAYDRPIWFWLIWLFLPIVAVFLVKQASYKFGTSSTGQAGTTFTPPTTFTPAEPATAFPGSDVQQSPTTFPSPTPVASTPVVTPTFQAPAPSPSSAPVPSTAQPETPSFPHAPVAPTDAPTPNAPAQTSAAAPAAEPQQSPTLGSDQPTPPPYNGQ